jgi:hypothetical protein
LAGTPTATAEELEMASLQSIGAKFLVNTTTANDQDSPQITALKDGRFVVTWRSSEASTNSSDIRGRVLAADGTGGTDFVVNTTTVDGQEVPEITALRDGGFVVAWVSHNETARIQATSGGACSMPMARQGATSSSTQRRRALKTSPRSQRWPTVASS